MQTTLEPYPHIKRIRVEADEESGDPVLVVTTDLNINSESAAFDEAAFDSLRKHVEAWQMKNFHRATIEGPTDG